MRTTLLCGRLVIVHIRNDYEALYCCNKALYLLKILYIEGFGA